MIEKVTAGRDAMGVFAPKFAELNDDVLFGQVWAREEQLSARDRSIVTVTALMASGILDSSLQHHIQNAKKTRRNGCGNGRASHPRCFLRRLAQGLGRTAHGEGNLRHGRLNSTSVCKSQAFLIRNAWLFEYPPSEYLLFSRVRLRLPVHLHENRNIHRKRKSHDRAADGNEYIRHCRWDAHP